MITKLFVTAPALPQLPSLPPLIKRVFLQITQIVLKVETKKLAYVNGQVDLHRCIRWPITHCQYVHCHINVAWQRLVLKELQNKRKLEAK